jgi:PIN domain nuclease of toxin-antitoxin system
VVVLDTHIAIWLLAGDHRLTESAAYPYIENASHRGILRIASISLFELGRMSEEGVVRFDLPLPDVIDTLLETPGLQVESIDRRIVAESVALGGGFPGDDHDRIICATARALRGSLVTGDSGLLRYAESGGLRTIAVQ